MSDKLFYREFHHQKRDMARFLSESHGFDTLYRVDGSPPLARTKLAFILLVIKDIVFLLARRAKIKTYRYIIALWHSAPAFMLLKRLGLIHYDRLLWFGFAARSPEWVFVYRWLVKLDKKNTWLVVFTEQEIAEYSEKLSIDRSHILFNSHGDWPQPIEVPPVFATDPALDLSQPFYFAGGFTNRDYQPVITAFKALGLPLIIVCSKTNTDVVDTALPANIKVYRDIPFPEFELLLRAAKAVIIPLRHDTGAAGHSVLVRSMRNGKIIIANDYRIVDNYLENGVDSLLLKDMHESLKAAVLKIEADPLSFDPIRQAARDRFERSYSQAALEKTMTDLINAPFAVHPADKRQQAA